MERHGQLPDVVDRLVLPLHQALLLRTFVRRLKGLEEEAADDGVGDDEAGQPDVGEEEGRGRLAVAHEALAGPSPSLPPRFLFHVPRHRLRTDDGCGSAFGCPVHCALHAGVSLLLVAEVWILHGACTRVCCVYTCTTCVSGCRFSLVGVGIDNLMLTRLRFYVSNTCSRCVVGYHINTTVLSPIYIYIYIYIYIHSHVSATRLVLPKLHSRLHRVDTYSAFVVEVVPLATSRLRRDNLQVAAGEV